MSDLPNGAEPLRLADGRIIMPSGRLMRPPPTAATPTAPPDPKPEPVRRSIDDLPDVPRVVNAACVVVALTLFGLDDDAIAQCTGADVERIGRIRTSDAYECMHEAVVRSVLEGEGRSVRDLFSVHARHAVDAMVEALHEGRRADRITAARDILDRAGHRPADVVEHRHRMEGGLIIEVIKRDTDTDAPAIDMAIE